MKLNRYRKGAYSPGAPLAIQIAWLLFGAPIVRSGLLPFSLLKRCMLRAFGARIGREVIIKPGVRIKFPWRLTVGDCSWIGEDVWIDNLASVTIGSHCVISQGAYLCTGDHNWKRTSFDLITKPIRLEDHSWVAAKVSVGPGVTLREGAIASLGSVVTRDLPAWSIFAGNPARLVRERPREDGSPTDLKGTVLLVNQSFYPDPVATAQYLTDLGEALADDGFEVTVLAGRRSYLDPSVRYPRLEYVNGVRIERTDSIRLAIPGAAGRVANALLFNAAMAWRLLLMRRFDKVIVLTSPPLIAWVCLITMKLKGSQLIYWVMDVNPEQAIRMGWIRRGSLLEKVLNAAFAMVLRFCDRIVVLDKYMHRLIADKMRDPDKISVVPLWTDTTRLRAIPAAQSSFRKSHSLERKFVVMYSGNHSLCHPLSTLLEAAECMREDSSTMFVFVGGGKRAEEVARFKSEKGLTNILSVPYQSQHDLADSLSAADLHVVTMGENLDGVVHPSKVYGIIGVQRPILFIGPSTGPVADILAQHRVGFHVQHGEVEQAVRLICNMKNESDTERAERQDLLTVLRAQFDRGTLQRELVDIISRHK